jgi:hypothetical protein
MCIPYDGIEYHHGLSVTKKTETGSRRFDILITKHREKQPYRYGGICLNNEYQVCTTEKAKPAAFIELIEKIIEDTLASEKEYAMRYPGETPVQVIKAEEKAPAVYRDFCEKMKDARLLDEYSIMHEDLKPFLEKPQFDPVLGKSRPVEINKQLEDIIPTISPRVIEAIYDCKDMNLTSKLAKNSETLKDCEIRYSRV